MTEVNFYINKKILSAWNKNKRYTVAYSGRGTGKSLQFAALCIIYAIQNPGSRILCVRGTQNKISESSLQTLKDVIEMLEYSSYFEITEHTLTCNNGSDFLFYGAKSYQSFKSIQGVSLVWVDEATELSEPAWDVLTPTIREDDSRFLISFNPELEDDWVYKEFVLQDRPDAAVVRLLVEDNPYFPEVLKRDLEYDRETNTLKYLHVWEGELVQASEGALWNKNMIKYPSREEFNTLDYNFDKIVVAIDPSITSNKNSDACGIIVACKDKDDYIILDDATEVMSPDAWASKAIALYEKWSADYIVYESNQGGDMVRTIINQKNPFIKCVSVHASRGKILRAEPIAQLYEQGKVMHLKHFKQLEYEMVTYTGDKKDKSPNSLDAMVWALTNLSRGAKAPPGMVKADMRQFGTMRLK